MLCSTAVVPSVRSSQVQVMSPLSWICVVPVCGKSIDSARKACRCRPHSAAHRCRQISRMLGAIAVCMQPHLIKIACKRHQCLGQADNSRLFVRSATCRVVRKDPFSFLTLRIVSRTVENAQLDLKRLLRLIQLHEQFSTIDVTPMRKLSSLMLEWFRSQSSACFGQAWQNHV